jgi:hypothetical protein
MVRSPLSRPQIPAQGSGRLGEVGAPVCSGCFALKAASRWMRRPRGVSWTRSGWCRGRRRKLTRAVREELSSLRRRLKVPSGGVTELLDEKGSPEAVVLLIRYQNRGPISRGNVAGLGRVGKRPVAETEVLRIGISDEQFTRTQPKEEITVMNPHFNLLQRLRAAPQLILQSRR